MITLIDATRLAGTKLRTRKIRTFITILLASMLFGVLVAGSLVITGAFRSVESFREDGLTSRYIVQVIPMQDMTSAYDLRRDPRLIAEAKKRYEELIEGKKSEAERLGIRYSQALDQPPYEESRNDGKETLRIATVDKTGIVHGLLEERYKDIPVVDDVRLETIAKQYGAIGLFYSESFDLMFNGTLAALPDGKEVFYDQSDEAERNANYTPPILDPTGITFAPPEITDPFMLPNNASWQPDGASLPIVLPQNAVERLLEKDGVSSDSMNATEKLDYLDRLRADAANLSFQACYRNNASSGLIQQTIQQQKDIDENRDEDDYQEPSVIYELPDPTKCENPIVVSDMRSDEEKKQDENQKIFDEKFNDAVDPVSYFITFKVVGISPAEPQGFNPYELEEPQQVSSMEDIINDLLKTSGVGQAIPRALYDELPKDYKDKYADLFTYKPLYFLGNEDNKGRFVEFANAADAQKFIDEQGCKTRMDGKCYPLERDYQLHFAFTNSAALDDMRSRASEWFGYAMLGVIVFAAVIMWITIGRAIADGRRETAVFRAIGFRRIDISGVYVIYTVILSLFVGIFAAVIGWLGAYITHRQLSPGLTAQAQYAFGGLDMTKEMSLMDIDQQQLLLIFVACFATGLLSMIIPLLSNVRRSPIRDMRDE